MKQGDRPLSDPTGGIFRDALEAALAELELLVAQPRQLYVPILRLVLRRANDRLGQPVGALELLGEFKEQLDGGMRPDSLALWPRVGKCVDAEEASIFCGAHREIGVGPEFREQFGRVAGERVDGARAPLPLSILQDGKVDTIVAGPNAALVDLLGDHILRVQAHGHRKRRARHRVALGAPRMGTPDSYLGDRRDRRHKNDLIDVGLVRAPLALERGRLYVHAPLGLPSFAALGESDSNGKALLEGLGRGDVVEEAVT